MLTTDLDGIWVLQALSGIELLASELGLRPLMPSLDTRELALRHPVADDLRAVGAITATGSVDDFIREWLTVLSRRDMALAFYLQPTPWKPRGSRAILARFDQWWVALERDRFMVRLSGAGVTTSEESAGLVIAEQVNQICGMHPPMAIRPVTLPEDELLSSVHDERSLRDFLRARKLDATQLGALMCAAQASRARQTSVVAIQSGAVGSKSGPHICQTPVTIIDSPGGRLVCDRVTRNGRNWVVISPGSVAHTASAVKAMMRRLPAAQDWYSYRKAV